MARVFFIVLGIAAGFGVISIALSSNSEDENIAVTCREDGIDSRKALNDFIESGLVAAEERRSDKILRLYVVDQKWHSMGDDLRAEIAFHGYCMAIDSSGRGTVLVKSRNSERILYSIVDGYFHPLRP